MAELSSDLIARISDRIRDRGRRHDIQPGAPLGMIDDPADMHRMFEAVTPGSGQAFQMMIDQMKRWGQEMPPMHVTQPAEGSISASTEDPHSLPLAPPASQADVTRIESLIGRRLPGDLRQLYAIADGGWGPGIAYTAGHGTGFSSLAGVAATLEDLRRRGPGYTGAMDWPANLVPIADMVGPVSYDLRNGAIIAFNDYYFDDGVAIEEAFTPIHPSLAAWLESWLAGESRA